MADGFRFEIDVAGFDAFRRSQPVNDELVAAGQRIAQAAGGAPDFEVVQRPSKSRARVLVRTATPAGMAAEATDRALTRALDAGRI
ncbi:hypothetical protein ACIPY5_12100 [Microbacterium sp. NPDC089698]|uniref:hypothetical protein n=1 Tax=Microbacterium sp. NPDC089698 TaxID=3364200 RepID=UPI003822995A